MTFSYPARPSTTSVGTTTRFESFEPAQRIFETTYRVRVVELRVRLLVPHWFGRLFGPGYDTSASGSGAFKAARARAAWTARVSVSMSYAP